MKHCVQIILVTLVCGSLGQSHPESPAADLLPPFEEAKPKSLPTKPLDTLELLPPFESAQNSSPSSDTSKPATFQCFSSVCMPKQRKSVPKSISSSSEPTEVKSTTTPKFTTPQVTKKPLVVSTQKPIEHTPRRTISETKAKSFESISSKNFKNSPALPDGSYKFSYSLEDGIQRQEQGSLQPGEKSAFSGQNVSGGYSYTAPDGQVISVQYVADEFGFRPVGSHIPAIPEPIARALKYLQSRQ